MSSQPYDVWVSLFSDKIRTQWEQERTELRKLSMIYCAFEHELTKLKTDVDHQLSQLKSDLKRKDRMLKCKTFKGLVQSVPFDDKENETCGIEPLPEVTLNGTASSNFVIESPSTPSIAVEPPKTASSPVIDKSREVKRKVLSPSLLLPQVRTPQNADETNILEASVISETPVFNVRKRSRSKLQVPKKKKSTKVKNNTLTQMFYEPKKTKEISSQLPSMSVTKMLDLINTEKDSESDDRTVDLDLPDYKNSFAEKYDRPPEREEPAPKFVYDEVVRGKQRKKLAGWACRECEDYYEALGLPPDQLQKKKDACSRHRYRFKPREETFKGFWDLTFGPTPKTFSEG